MENRRPAACCDARLDQHEGPLIIEGMMLLEALAGIGRKVDFLVYLDGPGTRSLSKMLAEYRARHQPKGLASWRLQGFTE